MQKREKEQSFLETSRKEDHMPWPPRRLESSRKCLHLAEKASRWCACALLLTYLLDARFCYLLCSPLRLFVFA